MQNGIQENERHPKKQAEYLIDKLYEHYDNYIEKSYRYEQENKSITKLFEKWFRGFDSSASDSMHQEFLDGIDKIVTQLSEQLKQIQQDAPDLCSDFAEKAVRRLMAPKIPRNQPRSNAEWYMTIAEYQCATLLPYLKLEVMEELRGTIFKVSRRMMFPKEREFFDEFERILKAKREQA